VCDEQNKRVFVCVLIFFFTISDKDFFRVGFFDFLFCLEKSLKETVAGIKSEKY